MQNNNAEQQQTNGDPHAASSGFVSPAVQERDFATEVESEVTEGVERSKPKRVPRQVEVDALNGYLCGLVVEPSSEGALICKKKACVTQWVRIFIMLGLYLTYFVI